MTALFCGVELAGRIEAAEARLVALASDAARARRGDTTGFARPIAGGVASFAEADSPFNKVAGLGFAGRPGAAEFAEVERAFEAYAAPVQVELATLADPAIAGWLTERGYRLTSYENVLGLDLTREPETGRPAGIEVRPSGPDEFSRWLDVVVAGVAVADQQGVPSSEEFPLAVVANAVTDLATAAGIRRYTALVDGVLAGGASFRIADGIAQFTGAATAPAYRRRGVQSALLAARIADATAAGCELAVVTTQPGSKSQQNVQRRGFDLLYARAILVRDTP